MGRTDIASRVIRASPQKIDAANLDPGSVAEWRPPQGMKAEVYAFDAREGGGYRMAFVYEDVSVRGKTSDNPTSASSSGSNSNPMIRRLPAP